MPAQPTQWGAAGSPTAVVSWLLSLLPGGTIINVGAGSGGDAEVGSQRLINVDLVRPHEVIGNLAIADAATMPFADGTFDGALAKDIIEHTLDPLAVLGEIRRVCRRDAALVVTVPRAIPRAVWADPTHIRGFTSAALTTALTMSGWEPDGPPRRIGGFPGAGRLGLEPHLVELMRIPGFGHWFGTNWFVRARPR